MKLLINTSNLYVGGGVQVALSFINELKNIDKYNEYHIFLSPVVNKQLNSDEFGDNFKFYLIEKSPSSLKNRYQIVKKLNYLENKIKPDIVFSIFAPSYWRPKTIHIVGFALGWITSPQSKAYQVLNFKQKIRRKLDSIYKTYYVKRDADYYIVETEDVKEKLFKVLNIAKEKIFIVGNAYSKYFEDDVYPIIELPIKEENEFRFITIAHNYPHKNIKILKEVIPYLQDIKLKYKFFITIDEENYNNMFEGLEQNIINIGQVEAKYCPSLYAQCDALFLPTLLESFTASYPEAMKMQKPILTSDLSFAHSLCKDAALYFDPLDPQDIAEKIIKLSMDNELQRDLVKKGIERLKDFETAESRARKYLEICEAIARKDKIDG